MRSTYGVLGRLLLGAVLVAGMGACAAAAVGAAAGAAGAIAYTERGATSNLDAPVEDVIAATDKVFMRMGIVRTSRTLDDDGEEAEITGEEGDIEVVVSIERNDDGLTNVQVTASENLVEYDRDRAEEVLRGIINEV